MSVICGEIPLTLNELANSLLVRRKSDNSVVGIRAKIVTVAASDIENVVSCDNNIQWANENIANMVVAPDADGNLELVLIVAS